MQQEIDEIMDNFDFEKVHKVMGHLGWSWWNGEGDDGVPSKRQLRKNVRHLMETLQDKASRDSLTAGTGGFYVTKYPDGSYRVSFEVADWRTGDG